MKRAVDCPIETPRLSYCGHSHNKRRRTSRPVVSKVMFLETAFDLVRMTNRELLGITRQLQVCQPAFARLLDAIRAEGSTAAAEWFVSCGIPIWTVFMRLLPSLKTVEEEEIQACAKMQHTFALPEICFCGFYQRELMEHVAQDLETLMDRGTVSAQEGNRLVWVTAATIEALDLAAAQTIHLQRKTARRVRYSQCFPA